MRRSLIAFGVLLLAALCLVARIAWAEPTDRNYQQPPSFAEKLGEWRDSLFGVDEPSAEEMQHRRQQQLKHQQQNAQPDANTDAPPRRHTPITAPEAGHKFTIPNRKTDTAPPKKTTKEGGPFSFLHREKAKETSAAAPRRPAVPSPQPSAPMANEERVYTSRETAAKNSRRVAPPRAGSVAAEDEVVTPR